MRGDVIETLLTDCSGDLLLIDEASMAATPGLAHVVTRKGLLVRRALAVITGTEDRQHA